MGLSLQFLFGFLIVFFSFLQFKTIRKPEENKRKPRENKRKPEENPKKTKENPKKTRENQRKPKEKKTAAPPGSPAGEGECFFGVEIPRAIPVPVVPLNKFLRIALPYEPS